MKHARVPFFYFLCWLLPVALTLLLTACEKGASADDGETPIQGEGNLVSLRFVLPENTAYVGDTEAETPQSLGEYLGRLSVAVFQDGKRLYVQHQTYPSAGFGTYQVRLAAGNYQVLAVLHNGEGNATVAHPDEVKFPNNKVTDTFYAYFDLNVTSPRAETITLRRATAKVLFRIGDPMPAGVAQMRYYYTGGSSTFDATTGYGCVNSRQTETFAIPSDYVGLYVQSPIYTFPHEQTGTLKLTVTALDAEGNAMKQTTYEDVDVALGELTIYDNYFFSEQPYEEVSDITFTLGATTDVSQIDCAY